MRPRVRAYPGPGVTPATSPTGRRAPAGERAVDDGGGRRERKIPVGRAPEVSLRLLRAPKADPEWLRYALGNALARLAYAELAAPDPLLLLPRTNASARLDPDTLGHTYGTANRRRDTT